MNIEQLLSPDVPVLKPTDTGEHALDIMDENYLTQLPLVSSDDVYVALVQDEDLLNWEAPESPLSKADFISFKPIINASSHPYEALKILHQMNLSVLPVVDNELKYLGSITKETLLNFFAENSGLEASGGVIVLELLPRNYSLYEIAKICENEEVIITNIQMRTSPNGLLEITLKLNRSILDAVAASFERHKYIVKEIYGIKTDKDDLTDNFNSLMNYLNM